MAADNDFYLETCRDLLERMINTVPRDVQLTEVIKPLHTKPDFIDVGKSGREPECLSLAWSADGQTLFAGYSDNVVRVYQVSSA